MNSPNNPPPDSSKQPTPHKDESPAPPGTVPYVPPSDTPPSSLTVVENFFQEELSDKVAEAVRTLPDDQTDVLRIRLGRETLMATMAFNIRQDGLKPAPPWLSEHSHITQNEIHVHEQMLTHAGVSTDIENVGALKHLALYCERTFLRDPLPENLGPNEQWREAAADALKQLVPILPLLRSGCFILGYSLRTRLSDLRTDLVIAERQLPQYAGTTRNYDDLSFFQNIYIGMTQRDGLTRELLKTRPDLTAEELRDAMVYSTLAREYRLTPITSSAIIARNYELEMQSWFGIPAAARTSGSARSGGLSPAVRYQTPSISGVQLPDIVKLRQTEEIFRDVRTALTKLDILCEEAKAPDNYQAYKRFIRECADDVVRPTYDRLIAIQKQGSKWESIGFGLGKAVALALHAIGKSGALPGAGAAARPADKAVQKAVGREARAQKEAARIALGVLKSILPTDPAE